MRRFAVNGKTTIPRRARFVKGKTLFLSNNKLNTESAVRFGKNRSAFCFYPLFRAETLFFCGILLTIAPYRVTLLTDTFVTVTNVSYCHVAAQLATNGGFI